MTDRFCVNCKHFLETSYCVHPSQERDPITGNIISAYCYIKRRSGFECGPDGVLYEQKTKKQSDSITVQMALIGEYIMDERTLIALKASIEKWERNTVTINPDEIKIGPIECPLCELFNNSINKNCYGCPVFEKTGSMFCKNTPYLKANILYDKLLRSMLTCWDEEENKCSPLVKQSVQLFREAASEEVEFLKSLLPTE